jgi:enamine deaminase RidA (YjgF/YER057c/UK114 family)
LHRNTINPPELAAPAGHYSHGVIVETLRTLYVAGQVALDSDGNLVGPDDPIAQTNQVFENV